MSDDSLIKVEQRHRMLVEAIINVYHTTRLSDDYVSHILSKPRTKSAFARFERDHMPPPINDDVRAMALEEAAQICDVLADGYARTGPDQAEIGLRNAGRFIRGRALIPIAPDGVEI